MKQNGKKNLLVFFSSPRKNGAVAALLSEFLGELDGSFNISVFDAYKENISACIDCKYCAEHERCALPDSDRLYPQLEWADVLVFAAPVYNMGVPAPLKAVIDRFQLYYNARFCRGVKPLAGRRKQAVLLAAAGSEEGGIEATEQMLRRIFTVMNTNLQCTVFLQNTDKGFSAKDKSAEIKSAVKKISEQ
jgi:multimeric flavodoxin WrbA